jgi:hypothetical protein
MARMIGRVDAAMSCFEIMPHLAGEDTFGHYVCRMRAKRALGELRGSVRIRGARDVRLRTAACPPPGYFSSCNSFSREVV